MVEAFRKYMLKRGFASATVKVHSYSLQKFIDWSKKHRIDPDYATYPDLLKYLKHLRSRDLSRNSLLHAFKALDYYYQHLIKTGKATNNPAKLVDIKLPRKRAIYQILTKPQLEGLYHHYDVRARRLTRASALASAHRYKMTVGLMVYQGIDTYELARLRTQNINFDKGTIHLTTSRKYNERILTLQSAQIMEMYRYLHEIRPELLQHFPQETDLLLIHGGKLYQDAHAHLITLLKRQEPLLTTGHQIRASVITHWLKAYNLREVQHMAGHRSVTSTERYLKSDIEGLQQDVDRFHPFA